MLGPFSLVEIAAVLVAAATTALVLFVVTLPLSSPSPSVQPPPGSTFYALGAVQEGLRAGDRAPELAGTFNGQPVGLTDLNGNQIRLSDLRGRPVWIVFWATWCPPCQEETPVLRDTYEKYAPDGLALIAISVQETSVDDVRAYVERYGLNYTVAFDGSSAVFHTYRAFGLPTHLFLDRDGVIQQVILGPLTRDKADEIVSGLVGDK
ncbi:MAG: TlpA disulfide reductase family protein [Chloroflexota bacterium]